MPVLRTFELSAKKTHNFKPNQTANVFVGTSARNTSKIMFQTNLSVYDFDYEYGTVVAQWIKARTLISEVPCLNLLAAAVMPLSSLPVLSERKAALITCFI